VQSSMVHSHVISFGSHDVGSVTLVGFNPSFLDFLLLSTSPSLLHTHVQPYRRVCDSPDKQHLITSSCYVRDPVSDLPLPWLHTTQLHSFRISYMHTHHVHVIEECSR
jgi:hypothetical protein